MAFIIAFIGLDGAGKTTLAKSIKNILENEYGLKCRYVWVKFGENIVGNVISKISKKKIKNNLIDETNPFAVDFKKNRFKLYLFYLLFEYWIRIIIHVRIPRLRGKTIVCDRFHYDTIVDIVINFNISYPKTKKIIQSLFSISRVDFVFYVKTPVQVAFERKKDVYTIEYLHERYKIYSKFEKNNNVITLDGTLPVDIIENTIKESIYKKMLKGKE